MQKTAIQMIGTQRSGSNLLRVMLHQLHISAPHPPHILERFMPLLPIYGDLSDENNFRNLIEDVCILIETNPVLWGKVQLDRSLIFERCMFPELVEINRVVYELKCDADQSNIWMCKSMANIHYIEELEKEIKPFYLHLYRDGRDVALSFKKAIVGEKHMYALAQQWMVEQELSIDLFHKLGTDRVICMKYEDLLSNPESELKRVCDFLHLDYNPIAMEYFQSEESKETANSGKMWENVQKPVISDNYNKFKKELSSEDILIFERVAGKTLQKLGYSLENEDALDFADYSNEEISNFKAKNLWLKQEANKQQTIEDKIKREKQNLHLKTLNKKLNEMVHTI